MDISERKRRLNETADATGHDRPAWYGAHGEVCGQCGVHVPEGYLLALDGPGITGCLRCLEQQAHLAYAGAGELPDDLVGTGGALEAQRRVAEDFRAHIKAAERGRPPPSRRKARSQWAARSGWEATAEFEPPEPKEMPSRWPERGTRPTSRAGGNGEQSRWQSRPWPRGKAGLGQKAERTAKAAPGPAELLGLDGVHPTRDKVNAAFRKCALACHPDYGGDADAFRKLVDARDALLSQCRS